ncbi:MAG: hypothetical protein IPL52_18155 [Flavobacteriales bacterium]|nr:hypothetical protein [Flavobacteriales bacterium]
MQNANKYQFRFRIPTEGVLIVKNGVGSNPWTYLNMANVVGSPLPSGAVLQPCAMYEVEVRASFDGGATWCNGTDPYTDLYLLGQGVRPVHRRMQPGVPAGRERNNHEQCA